MKISSVSKKVLASALSAAMVVAFAPTAAFAEELAAGKKVNVTYDMAGGVQTGSGTQEIVSGEALVVDAGNDITVSAAASTYTLNGYSIKDFFIDANGNGTKDDGETVVNVGTPTSTEGLVEGKTYKLVAEYNLPTVTVEAGAAVYTIKSGVPASLTDSEYGSAHADVKALYEATPGAHTLKTNLAPITPAAWASLDSTAQVYYEAVEQPTAAVAQDGTGTMKVVFAKGADIKNGNIYKVTVAKDGSKIAEANYTGATIDTVNGLTINFGNATAAGLDASGVIKVTDKIAAGTYTFTMNDMNANKGAGADVASAKIQVINVAADANGGVVQTGQNATTGDKTYGSTYTFMAVVGQTWETAIGTLAAANASLKVCKDADNATTYTDKAGHDFQGWKSGTTSVADDNGAGAAAVKVKATDTSIKADFEIAQVTKADYRTGTGITVYAEDLNESGYTYKAVFTAPDGSKLGEQNLNTQAGAQTAVISFGSANPALGEYSVSVVKTKTADMTSSTVGTAKVTIVKVVYSAGDGKFTTTPADTYTYVGAKLAASSATSFNTTVEGYAQATDSSKAFDKWTVDGAALVLATDDNGASYYYTVPAGTANVVTLTATYKVAKAAAPTYKYENGKITLASDAGSDYVIKYAVNSGAPAVSYNTTGSGVSIKDDGTEYLVAQVEKKPTAENAASLLGTSSLIDVFGYAATTNSTGGITAPLADFTAFANTALGAATNASKPGAPEYYSQVLPTVKKAGEDAVKAVGYATQAEWNAVLVAQKKAVLAAIADYELAQSKAAMALTKSADGKTYTYVSEASYASAVEETAAAAAKFDLNNDYKADGTTLDTANDVKKADGTAFAGAADYVAEIRKAAAATKTTVAAAVAEPAIAVNEQLAAVKTEADAKAAVEAFDALTAEQKALVSAADIKAAQEIVAAAEVRDAQDDAAVSKARDASKTVKAGKNGKTAKKQSVTLKKITSKSGAKVTYKKSSGSSKVSVKSGKAYLAKGVKKGTYKATVKATCGTQTAKIKVTFKVK